jgi:hypothetical protein
MNSKTLLGVCLIGAIPLTACGKKEDTIAQAEKKDVARGVPAPGIAEVKAIAEEGIIYGLRRSMGPSTSTR